MTPHRFSLNPFATSYIPLSRRETNRTFIAENSSNESIRANFPGYSEHNMHNPPYDNISPRLNMRHGEMAPVAIASPVQNHPFQGSLPHHISEFTEMEIVDREFNKDVEFLRTIFPGLSEQSIADVFLANEGDMDATIEMLCQLENNDPLDFECAPECLPDTLDIGDSPESGFVAVDQQTKNEASSSSRF